MYHVNMSVRTMTMMPWQFFFNIAAIWCISCLTPFINASIWIANICETTRNALLRNCTTHIAFIAQNQDDDQLEYITLYDLEQRSVMSLFWHFFMFERMTMQHDIGFTSHSFQYIVLVSRDGKGDRHLCVKPAWNYNPNAIPRAPQTNINSIVYSTLKVYGEDGNKLIDVTEPTKAILRGCQASRCALTMEMFLMLFEHLFNIRQNYHLNAELQVMDGKDFTEQIFKKDDLVRIYA